MYVKCKLKTEHYKSIEKMFNVKKCGHFEVDGSNTRQMGQGRVLLLTTVHQFLGINFFTTMESNLSERADKCV